MNSTIATQQSGFDPCRKIRDYIGAQQERAMHLSDILKAPRTLEQHALQPGVRTSLLDVAIDYAETLHGNLDCVALPKA